MRAQLARSFFAPTRRAVTQECVHMSARQFGVAAWAQERLERKVTQELQHSVFHADTLVSHGLPAGPFRLTRVPVFAFDENRDEVAEQSASERLRLVIENTPDVNPFELAEEDLKQVFEGVRGMLGSDHPLLAKVASYLFETPGKGMRPLICILLARALAWTERAAPALSALPEIAVATDGAVAGSSRSSVDREFDELQEMTVQPAEALWTLSNDELLERCMSDAADRLHMHMHMQEPGAHAETVVDESLCEQEVRPTPRQRSLAQIAEMIHTASLLHDDVIDESDTRRGRQTVSALFGSKAAILGGDFLLSRAAVELASLKSHSCTALMSRAIEALVKGEMLQSNPLDQEEVPARLAKYTVKNYYKTAALLANSCRSIALLGEHNGLMQQIAYEFGKHFGLAFQIVDDILDVTSPSTETGKPAHADMENGVATAPILYASHRKPELNALVARRFRGQGDAETAMSVLLSDECDGLARARALAEFHAGCAIAALLQLPPSQSRSALIQLVRVCLERRK
ncbi:MAG: hypothetical protein MHM6MM_001668 [Cercozoa sp. M6MM]